MQNKHPKAAKLAGLAPFPLYTFHHTCLTMDPYTLAYLAGHSDFSTTKRYVHRRRTRFEKRWNVPE